MSTPPDQASGSQGIAQTGDKPGFFYGWVIVAVCFALGFLGSGIYAYAKGIFLIHLADELAAGSRMHISIGFSSLAVIGALISPALGKYLDNQSPRTVMLVGVLLLSIAYTLLALAQELWQFYLIVAFGFGLSITAIGTMTRSRAIISWFDLWRGRAFGVAIIGASLTGIVIPPLANWIVEGYGWRVGYLAFAGITFGILLPVVYLWMKDSPGELGEIRDGRKVHAQQREKPVQLENDDRVWTWQELLKFPAFWSIGCMFGTMACVYTVVMLHLFGHLLDIGITSTNAAIVLSCVALASVFGKPILGWLADRYGARLTICLSLMSQAFALYAFTLTNSFMVCVLIALLHGFGYSGLALLRTFAMSTSVGSRSIGLAYGVGRWIELPFILIASPLAGLVHDISGSYDQAFVTLAIMLLCACLGTRLISSGGARERKQPKAGTPSQASSLRIR